MLHIITCIAGLALALPCLAFEPVAPAPAVGEVRDLGMPFAHFWDRTQAKPIEQRVAQFKREIAPLFPAFYGIERYAGSRTQAQQDERIRSAIEGFPAIRNEYLRKARQFERELPRYTASFKAHFPDYRPTKPIYFLHSLNEMDGGTRDLAGQNYLIFGVDRMVSLHGTNDESAFFHHELFHVYHQPSISACSGDALWTKLWTEGLATYVSQVLNPAATDQEMLLDFPPGMPASTRKMLRPALVQLERVLDSSDAADHRDLFTMAGTDAAGLPKRRGYYLGYLVAKEAAKMHSLPTLAKLDCDVAREEVYAAVQRLKLDAGKVP